MGNETFDLTHATPKDYKLIIYNKTEIDTKMSDESTRVDNELSLKLDRTEVGSSVGTLDEHGKQSYAEVSYATSQDASNGTATDKTMTPKLVRQEIDSLDYISAVKYIPKTDKGVAYGVPTLDYKREIELNQIPDLDYIEEDRMAMPSGVATLDGNGKLVSEQMPDISSINSFYEPTIADMLALTGVEKDDRCIVYNNTADESKNGEYIALVNNPTMEAEWGKVPQYNAVSSVNGMSGNVTITSIDESAQNKNDISSLNSRVGSNEVDISGNSSDILSNSGRITSCENNITDNTVDIDALEVTTDILSRATSIISKSGVDIDTIVDAGIFEVDLNLPTTNDAELRVFRYYSHPTTPDRVVQRFRDNVTAEEFIRAANDYNNPVWSSFVNITGILDDLENVDLTTVAPTANDPLVFDGTNWVAKGGDINVELLNVKNNIKFIPLSDPSYEGMTLQVGSGGQIEAVAVPALDHIQSSSYVSNTYLDTAAVQFFSITSDIEYTPDDSTASLILTFNNANRSDVDVYIDYKIGGSTVTTKTYSIPGNASGHQIVVAEPFVNSYPSGTVFTVELRAASSGDILLAGENQTAFFRLKKTDVTSEEVYQRLEALESAQTDMIVPKYEYSKIDSSSPIIIEDTDYREVLTLARTTNYPAGTYEISFSASYKYSTTSRSAGFSWSIDGGTTWQEFTEEVKDTKNTNFFSYSFPIEHLGGGINFMLDAKCGSSSDTLEIKYGNIIFELKKQG
jgi:hypothetical protein